MQKMIRYGIGLALLAFAATANVALAQSVSGGGSIGNDEKSLSGSRSAEPAPQARRSRPDADEPPRSSSRRSGGAGGSGGGSNFDGAWVVVSVGTTCSGSSMTAVVVSSGRIIGEGLTGTVNPNGFASSVGNYNGIAVISSGHVSGRSGAGTFKRSDGCVGRWTSSKQ
jgi:hypothetical protein